jgi:hypothetical protein
MEGRLSLLTVAMKEDGGEPMDQEGEQWEVPEAGSSMCKLRVEGGRKKWGRNTG